jgi:hypothetical protein
VLTIGKGCLLHMQNEIIGSGSCKVLNIFQNWSKIPESIKYVPVEIPEKGKTVSSKIIAYQPFRSQLTCPEITDEIAAIFSDLDVVLIATMSQLRCQFHDIYARVFCMKVLFSSYILVKKALSYEKHACKMLMKLTSGVNFITFTRNVFVRKCIV